MDGLEPLVCKTHIFLVRTDLMTIPTDLEPFLSVESMQIVLQTSNQHANLTKALHPGPFHSLLNRMSLSSLYTHVPD